MKLGDQLRKAIDSSDLSRYRICKLIGLDKSVMSRFMAHKSGLRLEVVEAICEVLRLELKKRKG